MLLALLTRPAVPSFVLTIAAPAGPRPGQGDGGNPGFRPVRHRCQMRASDSAPTPAQPSRFAPLGSPGGSGQLSAVVCLSACLSMCMDQQPALTPSPASPRLAGSSGTITLRCKDLKVLQLEIPGMEECLNIASSIEVSSRVAREPGPSHVGVQRVGRRKQPPAVFALGLPLTWVNTRLPDSVGKGCPKSWWCQRLPAQPSLAAGTRPGAGNGDGVCRALGTFPATSVFWSMPPTRDQLHLCSYSRPSPRWTL